MKNILREIIREGYDGEDIFSSKSADTAEPFMTAEEREQTAHLAALVDKVYETDPYGKALTGRTPELIEQETGIPQGQMFPENARILYVGDPWQKMGRVLDRPNLTIMDYEFGDSASFIHDEREFFNDLGYKIQDLQGNIKYALNGVAELLEEDRNWLEEFSKLVEYAADISQKVKKLDEYPKIAEAWRAAREHIEKRYQKILETISETRKGDPGEAPIDHSSLSFLSHNGWYQCVFAERGFRDIPDWQKIILPRLQIETQKLKDQSLGGEEIDEHLGKLAKTMINELRTKKIPEKANVVQAVFPALPFKKDSFDRFIASWSISAHTFANLDEADFAAYWQEIARVLKPGGEAYIFPLKYSDYDDAALTESLARFSQTGLIESKFLDQTGGEADSASDAETLWMKKR